MKPRLVRNKNDFFINKINNKVGDKKEHHTTAKVLTKVKPTLTFNKGSTVKVDDTKQHHTNVKVTTKVKPTLTFNKASTIKVRVIVNNEFKNFFDYNEVFVKPKLNI